VSEEARLHEVLTPLAERLAPVALFDLTFDRPYPNLLYDDRKHVRESAAVRLALKTLDAQASRLATLERALELCADRCLHWRQEAGYPGGDSKILSAYFKAQADSALAISEAGKEQK
jgi:hypothetical protein